MFFCFVAKGINCTETVTGFSFFNEKNIFSSQNADPKNWKEKKLFCRPTVCILTVLPVDQ